MNLPTLAAPKGRLTEAEARMCGAAANRLVNLRGLLADCSSGASLTVQGRNGTAALSMSSNDTQAVLALLIERESAFLAGFDIELDRTAS